MPEQMADTLPGLLDGIAHARLAEDEVPEDTVHGSGRKAARLSDGSGYLIVDGPGAGSVVASSTSTRAGETSPLPARDETLDGAAPLFLLHKGNYAKAFPRLLAHLHAACGKRLALGVISRLPQASAQAHQDFNDGCHAAAVRVIDPECYRTTGQQELRLKEPCPTALGYAPYLGGQPIGVAELLALQRTRGANLLLTPGRTLDPSDSRLSLDTACADGQAALAALESGERLGLNLTMSASWLTKESLREALLAQLLDHDEFDTWYVRVQWPKNLRSYAQPIDKGLIAGYRALAELAADEDRRLLLPQTGLSGWLMLGFGAAGFGAGTSGSLQAFQEERAGGNGNQSRIERYFERVLLHTIERTAQRLIKDDPAYTECACPYCRPLFDGSGWKEEYAGLHYLFNAGVLAAEVAPSAARRGGTRSAVRQKVRAARKFADGKALTSINVPEHLEIWDQHL